MLTQEALQEFTAESIATAILDLVSGKTDPEDYQSVERWIQQWRYHRPSDIELAMCAINELLETYGVEALFFEDGAAYPRYTYCNTGDTYAATVCYDYDTEEYLVASWGDLVEEHEQENN